MGWQVALSETAEADLEALVAFIARKNPAAAERIGMELVALIFALNELPSRGAPVKKRPGLRKLAHRHYLIIYRVNQAQTLVEVIRVWDARQDPKKLILPQ